MKLKRYGDATETYNGVINTYAPVRDELDALLTVNKDPVAYFDNLLLRNERNLDVNTLLPPVALKWATTQSDVTNALNVVKAMEDGRRGVSEGQTLADRILKTLGERGMEAFPALQEGYTRADSISNALVSAEESLTSIESQLVAPVLTQEETAQLAALEGRGRLRPLSAGCPAHGQRGGGEPTQNHAGAGGRARPGGLPPRL